MHLRISENVVFRDLAGEVVLLNLATGAYFGLDLVGTRVWQLIGEHGATETVLEALLAEYEVEEETLRSDVDALIRALLEKGLLTNDAQNKTVG